VTKRAQNRPGVGVAVLYSGPFKLLAETIATINAVMARQGGEQKPVEKEADDLLESSLLGRIHALEELAAVTPAETAHDALLQLILAHDAIRTARDDMDKLIRSGETAAEPWLKRASECVLQAAAHFYKPFPFDNDVVRYYIGAGGVTRMIYAL
jgi:hypothetical protein